MENCVWMRVWNRGFQAICVLEIGTILALYESLKYCFKCKTFLLSWKPSSLEIWASWPFPYKISADTLVRGKPWTCSANNAKNWFQCRFDFFPKEILYLFKSFPPLTCNKTDWKSVFLLLSTVKEKNLFMNEKWSQRKKQKQTYNFRIKRRKFDFPSSFLHQFFCSVFQDYSYIFNNKK